MPRSGSAYVYIYVTIGEFIAFVLGWDLVLEYMIGVSSGASAITGYLDSLVDNKISTWLNSTMPMHVPELGPYPDLVSFGFVMAITRVILCTSHLFLFMFLLILTFF